MTSEPDNGPSVFTNPPQSYSSEQTNGLRAPQPTARRDTMPDDDLLVAAQAALQEEDNERHIILQHAPSANSPEPTLPSAPNDDHPPSYEP